MKIRTGFVSNSSSSSFIVSLSKEPASAEELQRELFGRRTTVNCHEDSVPADEAAESIFKQIKKKDKIDDPVVLGAALASGSLAGAPDYDDPEFQSKKTGKTIWSKYEAALNKHGEKQARKFMEDNTGRVFYELDYADEDGTFGRVMEHGDAWDDVPHVRISKH